MSTRSNVSHSSGPSWGRAVAKLLLGAPRKRCVFTVVCIGVSAVCCITFVILLLATSLMPDSSWDDSSQLFSMQVLAELQQNSTKPLQDTASSVDVEIWAKGFHSRDRTDAYTERLTELLSQQELAELTAICGRCLWHSMHTAVTVHGVPGSHVFVATGDIDDQWVRDSAVQLAIYLPRLGTHPALRQVG